MGGVNKRRRERDQTSEQIAVPSKSHTSVRLTLLVSASCWHWTASHPLISPLVLWPATPLADTNITSLLSPSLYLLIHASLSLLIHLINSLHASYVGVTTVGSVKVVKHPGEYGTTPATNFQRIQDRKWHVHTDKIPRLLEANMLNSAQC